MKVTRILTLPGRREYESSTFEIELIGDDLTLDQRQRLGPEYRIQDVLQVLARDAQARVLACHVADGTLSNDEMTERLIGFLGDTPEWLNRVHTMPNPHLAKKEPEENKE